MLSQETIQAPPAPIQVAWGIGITNVRLSIPLKRISDPEGWVLLEVVSGHGWHPAVPMTFQAGQTIICSRQQFNRIQERQGAPLVVNQLEFQGETMVQFAGGGHIAAGIVCHGVEDHALRVETRQLFSCTERIHEAATAFRRCAALIQILAHTIASRGMDQVAPQPAGLPEQLVSRARELLASPESDHLCVKNVAKQLAISDASFRRTFRRITGLPPHQYRMQLKLKKSCALLRDTSLNISEIARQLGFRSHAYFIRFFRHHCGMTPGAYRKGRTLDGQGSQEPEGKADLACFT